MSELTDFEHETLKLTGQLANNVRCIIGDGPQAENDWGEAAFHIHAIQRMIMSQAAARSYPDMYRLLGKVIELP